MSAAKPVHPSAELQALRSAGYTDCTALYKLTNLVKLAALACEARRTLEGINGLLNYHPTAREAVMSGLNGPTEWADMDDVVGDVLKDVGDRLESLSDTIANRPAELAKRFGGVDHE